jgi:hypothetical protein
VRRATLGALAAAALACGAEPAEPGPHVRIVSAAPEGGGVAVGAAAEVRFTAAVDGDGLLDGRWAALVEGASLRAAVAAAEAEGATAQAIAVRATLADGATRLVLVPAAPLRPWTPHAVVLSSRARGADGRPVLDPEGRRRTFVATFETGPPDGPPPAPALTEARVHAEAPQAGGEYVEVANLGEGALDLGGWRLSRRSPSGAVSSCAIGAGVVPARGAALLAGGAWDGRYALPAGVPVLTCGAGAVVGGLADDRAPALALLDPLGTVRATLGGNGGPVCEVALERIRADRPDAPENLRCGAGSPGR